MICLGIDIGGTNIKVVWWDSEPRRVIDKTLIEYNPPTFSNFLKIFDKIFTEKKCDYVGIAVPGTLDLKREIVLLVPNLSDWGVVPLKQILYSKYNIRVHLENDANAAAFAEFKIGAGKDTNGIVLLTLGTGVGGGVVLNDNLLIGANGGGVELGHFCVDANGFECKCGNIGCLEQYVSKNGIIRLAYLLDSRKRVLSPLEWSELADEGEKTATQLWKIIGHYVGLAVVSYINLFHPSRIIIGGGIANAGEKLLSTIRNVAFKRAFLSLRKDLTIVPAELGNDAGAVGMALIAQNNKEQDNGK